MPPPESELPSACKKDPIPCIHLETLFSNFGAWGIIRTCLFGSDIPTTLCAPSQSTTSPGHAWFWRRHLRKPAHSFGRQEKTRRGPSSGGNPCPHRHRCRRRILCCCRSACENRGMMRMVWAGSKRSTGTVMAIPSPCCAHFVSMKPTLHLPWVPVCFSMTHHPTS